MKIIMTGQGKEFFFLCRRFLEKGYNVTLICKDENEGKKLFRDLKISVIEGDPCDIQTLKHAGAEIADVFLAMSENDHDNLISCQISANRFGLPRVIALANDPENVEIFEKLGVKAFSITSIIASLIEERTATDNILNLQPAARGLVNITEVKIHQNNPVINKPLRSLELPQNILIGIIVRNGKAIVPGGNNCLLAGDSVVLLSLPENHGKAIKFFSGENK
ncbi:MAG: trk/ktr system potassium uptake protein [Clostridiales bacterium]|jgi:trk system potassium uptake protein TrkA|nr:trk/ktr system potassium uptake protein [Clostridiales bacterium]MDN5282519.1 trk/ktr system potassium uptake protein [Candidatus Ozemobacter sp.]